MSRIKKGDYVLIHGEWKTPVKVLKVSRLQVEPGSKYRATFYTVRAPGGKQVTLSPARSQKIKKVKGP